MKQVMVGTHYVFSLMPSGETVLSLTFFYPKQVCRPLTNPRFGLYDLWGGMYAVVVSSMTIYAFGG